jgi:ketosteroid isomerase-like protein
MKSPMNQQIEHIQQLEDRIGQAVRQRDAALVEQLCDEDFAYTGPRGELKTKADIVRELQRGEPAFEQLRVDNVNVRLHGETAVVTGLATTRESAADSGIAKVRYTRVYQQKNGIWKLTAFQGTPLAA